MPAFVNTSFLTSTHSTHYNFVMFVTHDIYLKWQYPRKMCLKLWSPNINVSAVWPLCANAVPIIMIPFDTSYEQQNNMDRSTCLFSHHQSIIVLPTKQIALKSAHLLTTTVRSLQHPLTCTVLQPPLSFFSIPPSPFLLPLLLSTSPYACVCVCAYVYMLWQSWQALFFPFCNTKHTFPPFHLLTQWLSFDQPVIFRIIVLYLIWYNWFIAR